MTEIHLITKLTQTECIAELSCILEKGLYQKSYACKRYAADSVQRSELKALAAGLKEIRCPSKVVLHLKSSHLIAAIRNDWPNIWKQNDWKNQKGNLVRDWELWKEIVELVEKKELVLIGGN